jgi:tRNA nucleotidyltransferase/poly(A) polymerase
VIFEQPMGERFVMLSLERTDERVREGKSISPGFLFATLLWHEVLADWEKRKAAGESSIPAMFESMTVVLDQQAEKLAITRRIATDIKDIWLLQPRFEARAGKRPYRLLELPRLPRRLRLSPFARRIRRSGAGTGRLVDSRRNSAASAASAMPRARWTLTCCCMANTCPMIRP